jgi:hypothetical protein
MSVTVTIGYLQLVSKVVKSQHLGAPNSQSSEVRSCLAPFGPSKGFQGSGHMDPLKSLGVVRLNLSHDLVKVMVISLWSLG